MATLLVMISEPTCRGTDNASKDTIPYAIPKSYFSIAT